MKSINKYITLNTKIVDNQFNIGIRSSNNISILINNDYEVLLGIFNNSKSIIRDVNNNKIIQSLDHKSLEKDFLLNYSFNFGYNIIIKKDDDIIFSFKNIYENYEVNSIKIKNNGNYNTELSYEHINNSYNYGNVKVHLMNNNYEDIDDFYKNNYLDYYIQRID